MTSAACELTIDVAIEDAQWEKHPALEEIIGRALNQAAVTTGARLRPGAEVSVLLCDDQFIAGLNRQWRDRDAPTNVLSFPSSDGSIEDLAEAPLLGDIIIAYETTAREASEENKSFQDHFTHLAVHGFLHLIGYDHVVESEAEVMEGLERDILATLGIDDPYIGAGVASTGTA
jgi:probable rRNA maturation factor